MDARDGVGTGGGHRGKAGEARDEEGATELLRACWEGRTERVLALLAVGCDAAAVNNMGQTALVLAAARMRMSTWPNAATAVSMIRPPCSTEW